MVATPQGKGHTPTPNTTPSSGTAASIFKIICKDKKEQAYNPASSRGPRHRRWFQRARNPQL